MVSMAQRKAERVIGSQLRVWWYRMLGRCATPVSARPCSTSWLS